MVGKKYWSFKLLLASDQERTDNPHDKAWKRANMSVPFLATETLTHANQTDQMYDLGAEDNAFSEKQFQTTEIEDANLLDNINELSIVELHRLRRTIALKLHPDRNRGRPITCLTYEMSDVNLLIDNAIRKKSTF